MIRFDNINIEFNGVPLYNNPISTTIGPNEFVCVIGRSGIGKSVLTKILLGNMQPTSGAVYVNDTLVTKPSRRLSVVYQEHFILPWLTLRENILLGHPTPTQTSINSIADKLSIAKYLDMYPKTVSTGTKQRASIARALVADTDIIVMDEPLSSVDEITSQQIRKDISLLCKDKITIYITHDLYEVLELATRIIVIGHSGVVKDLARSEVTSTDMLLDLCNF